MLSEDDQWNELWENGAYLTHRCSIGSKYALYALHKFFVQVELDAETDEIIEKVEFKTGELLDRYAGKIEI